MEKLIDLVEDTFRKPEMMKVVKAADVVIKLEEVQPTGRLHDALIRDLKKRYEFLDLNTLLLLWHENYHTMKIMKGTGSKDNEASYLVRNKVIAIGSIINEQY